MTRKRCKRTPVRTLANPVALAIAGACKLTPAEQLAQLRPARNAFEALRCGRGSLRAWRAMADAFNIAEALATLNIAGNLDDMLHAGQRVLASVLERARTSGGIWGVTDDESRALDDALFVARVQLEHCSVSELDRAVERVSNRIAQALAGNGGPRVTVHCGAGLDDDAPRPTP